MQPPAAAGGAKRKITVLPHCQYGDKCYRKAESHLDAFSHPCPYGGACYRTNEDHRRRRWHPGDGSDSAHASDDESTPAGAHSAKKKKKDDGDGSPPHKSTSTASDSDSPPVSPDPHSAGGSSKALKGTLSMLRKQIVLRILEAGGKWRDNFLIATQNEVVGQTSKAMNKSVPIVTEEFLWDSIKAGKPLDYKKYQISDD